MYGCILDWWAEKWPNFIVKNGQQKPRHKIVAVFVGPFWFLLSQSLCLFLLVSSYFLLFHDILEPQNSPPNEVTGFYIYIYIYIYILCVCIYTSIYVRLWLKVNDAWVCRAQLHELSCAKLRVTSQIRKNTMFLRLPDIQRWCRGSGIESAGHDM